MDILGPFRPIEQEFMKVILQSSSCFQGNKQFTSEFGRKFLKQQCLEYPGSDWPRWMPWPLVMGTEVDTGQLEVN